MRIMVTGSDGMLGKAVIKSGKASDKEMMSLPHTNLDIRNYPLVSGIMEKMKPDILINCAGITNDKDVHPLEFFEVNSIAPLKLSHICKQFGVDMVQISTDCVFNGKKGAPYTETSREFADDVYGMSKLLGEVGEQLTVRCSFLGFQRGLLGWLFKQKGDVPGYINAWWNGLTVDRVADEIIYQAVSGTKGILHIFGEDITKYDILVTAKEVYNLQINIVPVEEPKIDRRLRTNRNEYIMVAPDIKTQLEELSNFVEAK